MPYTDQSVQSEIQYALLETVDGGASWSSGVWTTTEVQDYLNQRQQQFLLLTGCVLTRATVPVNPNTTRAALPADWLLTARVGWRGQDGIVKALSGTDEQDLDSALEGWGYLTEARPRFYTDMELPTLEIQIAPGSYQAGQIELLYQAVGTTLAASGVVWTVPALGVPACKYGVLADMLKKAGRAQRPEMARICEGRFQFGVLAMQVLLGGFQG